MSEAVLQFRKIAAERRKAKLESYVTDMFLNYFRAVNDSFIIPPVKHMSVGEFVEHITPPYLSKEESDIVMGKVRELYKVYFEDNKHDQG